MTFFNSSFWNLRKYLIELDNFSQLQQVFGWGKPPLLKDKSIYDYEFIEDANQRRIRDAESLGGIARNINPKICLDIGTGLGHSAALMAQNAPKSHVYTINIDAMSAKSGQGGKLITGAYIESEIGSYYKAQKLKNITQIIANTEFWHPDFSSIDLAFVDGCHDTEFVFKDTQKILPLMSKNGFLVWHDFNFDLKDKFDWIKSVCLGVEKLYQKKLLSKRLYHVRNSWMGVYQL